MFVEGIMSLDQCTRIDLMKAIKDNMSRYINDIVDHIDDNNDDTHNISIDNCTQNDDDDDDDDGVNCTLATMDGISDLDTAPNSPLPVTSRKIDDDNDNDNDNNDDTIIITSPINEGQEEHINDDAIAIVDNDNSYIIEKQTLPDNHITSSTSSSSSDIIPMFTQVLACQECDKQKGIISKLQKDINNAIQRYHYYYYYYYYHYYYHHHQYYYYY